MNNTATALAHPNIAFIKYWGLADEEQHIPANDSISMNLGGLTTRTTVTLDPALTADTLALNGVAAAPEAVQRVQRFLDRVRSLADEQVYARVESENNFPTGAGVASSAAAFAALALAGSAAFGLVLSEPECSSLARFGSGSACRSIPGGFVEWHSDPQTGPSFAHAIAPASHWDLVDCVVILSEQHKPVGSAAGMRLAKTSPLQAARVQDAPRRLALCRQAIFDRDFDALAQVAELDSNLMHSVMMTSEPPLFYWQPSSLAIMQAVQRWRAAGLPVAYTLDAGPNVHLICLPEASSTIQDHLRQFPEVKQVLECHPGGPTRLLS